MENPQNIENSNKLCRICFNTGEYELHSHELIVDDSSIVLNSVLKELSSFNVNDDNVDNIPSMLCVDCANELGQCYIFLKKLRKADEQLQQLVEETRNENKKEHSNKEDHNDDKDIEPTTIEVEIDKNKDFTHTDTGNKEEHDNNDINLIISEDDDENYLIEYINEENLIENDNEQEGEEEEEEEGEEEILQTKKGIKRKINNNKTPNIIITDNVSHILSKIRKSSENSPLLSSSLSKSPDTSIELNDHLIKSKKSFQQNQKHSSSSTSIKVEPVTDKDCFVITKFVLTGDETTIDDNNIENTNSSTINQIRFMDLAPVEVNASSNIENKESDDDETHIEDPNTMYKCKYCPRAYSTSYYLIKHARKAHNCQFCMKGFEKTEDLFKHTKEEHNQFKCTLCDKNFVSNSNLRLHMKKIHNVKLPARTSILSYIKKE